MIWLLAVDVLGAFNEKAAHLRMLKGRPLCFRLTLEAQHFLHRESYLPSNVGRLEASSLPPSAEGHGRYLPARSQLNWRQSVGEGSVLMFEGGDGCVGMFHGDTQYSHTTGSVTSRTYRQKNIFRRYLGLLTLMLDINWKALQAGSCE